MEYLEHIRRVTQLISDREWLSAASYWEQLARLNSSRLGKACAYANYAACLECEDAERGTREYGNKIAQALGQALRYQASDASLRLQYAYACLLYRKDLETALKVLLRGRRQAGCEKASFYERWQASLVAAIHFARNNTARCKRWLAIARNAGPITTKEKAIISASISELIRNDALPGLSKAGARLLIRSLKQSNV